MEIKSARAIALPNSDAIAPARSEAPPPEGAHAFASILKRLDRAPPSETKPNASPQELLAVQRGVYEYAYDLAIATKAVDAASSAVKTVLGKE